MARIGWRPRRSRPPQVDALSCSDWVERKSNKMGRKLVNLHGLLISVLWHRQEMRLVLDSDQRAELLRLSTALCELLEAAGALCGCRRPNSSAFVPRGSSCPICGRVNLIGVPAVYVALPNTPTDAAQGREAACGSREGGSL